MVKKQVIHVSTQEGYDRWSNAYDQEDNPLVSLDDQLLIPLLPDVRGLKVLELGCGTGRVTRHFSNADQVVALDVSSGMLEVAKKSLAGHPFEFQQCDLNQPWQLDHTFDLIVSALVLEHISSLLTFFACAKQSARPTTRFICSAMHPAMFLLQKQAHFVDQSGLEIRFESFNHQMSDFINAALKAGFKLEFVQECIVNEKHQTLSAKLAKFEGWPMWLGMGFTTDP
ncbi:MAG: methyltransferase domain-containing protein [Acidobacteria bacterium]|nr:methyltransferase domain-containing protein [Acidobacteriota bacterium]